MKLFKAEWSESENDVPAREMEIIYTVAYNRPSKSFDTPSFERLPKPPPVTLCVLIPHYTYSLTSDAVSFSRPRYIVTNRAVPTSSSIIPSTSPETY